ncbi:tRNA (adenosine(37)-N6)-threonylcarbamoyltransferase complex dimerization subunit type 1 TsaB [Sphingobacterium alkalisoli]|uniref:tRNA (Adenosine(37)-N6)-threonylcarbamoyltransferase complex dimerization subunit type 1 TsaB n=1 Tax=Sphingobacterium alkalisoli TaxID=1874115 RepID=A0A4U0GPC4_9SPHI|nr:tRNA (adenosine(37)-N6)-threonylcarbamoyltransferase complex dimerization subunit type 1 TsaB [Sphingobacterium alkalisoli]TJY60750.1 tRNA (adenosine(37)-N6)-threonylcarbamoyltransferase complex dimerization subunit type 1 TsaB [Sphingobacterium alkalisoli]GGH31718.1 tRNA (adenosine(37)-N6)-threonylcarbamoyltransferase complex dimerization subunit type 1 TsaB [Sphingobacterium alkalisoli]
MKLKQYIIQIDTATEVCSVSINREGIMLDHIQSDEPNMHASRLTVYVEQLLSRNSLQFSDIAAIAVSMGPGSYTGLRIGVSTAKGLCYALDIPLIGINTLESMYNGLSREVKLNADSLYLPMIDARRMEVYTMVFNAEGKQVLPTQAKIIDEFSFTEFQEKKVFLFGSGAGKFKELFDVNPQVNIISTFQHSSGHMSTLAWQRFTTQEFENLIYFEPYYLKEFVASVPKR